MPIIIIIAVIVGYVVEQRGYLQRRFIVYPIHHGKQRDFLSDVVGRVPISLSLSMSITQITSFVGSFAGMFMCDQQFGSFHKSLRGGGGGGGD